MLRFDADASSAEHQRVFEQAMAQLGLAPRVQQQQLVDLARDAVARDRVQFVQAGTGVGKSFAALSTAIEARRVTDRPSVVVCPTNRLIDQYVVKDAPRIAAASGADIQYLKGRGRYLCSDSFGFETRFGREAAKRFRELTADGALEWAQHPGLDESFGCSGDCENEEHTCGVQLARKRASTADVVVTNGHLLVWDQLVQGFTAGSSRLLPHYGALFVDECHELDAVARGCLSDRMGPNAKVYEEVPDLRKWVMRQVTEACLSSDQREAAVDPDDPELRQMRQEAVALSQQLGRELDQVVALGDPALKKTLKKRIKALDRFVDFSSPSPVGDGDGGGGDFVSSIVVEPDDMYPGGLKPYLNRLCIDASGTVWPILSGQPSVLISGTVPPSLARRLTGSRSSQTAFQDVGTPFDYSRSVLAVSSFSPKIRDHELPRLTELKGAVVDMASRSHDQGGGGTLVLTTSWRDLDLVAGFLAANLPSGIPVLTQHRTDAADTAEMLAEFAAHGHAVLVGTRGLWTGVDVPGPALRQVVLWKLPYGVPTLETRAVQNRFGYQVYLDDMIQQLVQGVGRLVRTVEDDGRVIISDDRARSIAWSANPMSGHLADFSKFWR